MRKKYILFRVAPFLVILFLIVLIIQNGLLDNSESMPGQQSNESFGEQSLNRISDVVDSINGALWGRAFSESEVNLTTLYESIPLTRLNLAQQGHLCKSDGDDLFVGLMSKPDAFEQRNVIRDTLGRQVSESKQKMLFFIGKSKNETVNQLVEQEFATGQDIVRLAFVEDYYNLTLKTLAFLEYFNDHCNHFKFAIKLDDDVFLNWQGMQSFLLEQAADERPAIYCHVLRRARVIRDLSNKWYMDRKNYPAPFYPDYCKGLGYILNRKAVRRVLEQHAKTKKKILYFEDVYTTGICTSGTDILLVNEAKLLNHGRNKFFLRNYLNHSFFMMHPIRGSDYRNLYQKVKNLPGPG